MKKFVLLVLLSVLSFHNKAQEIYYGPKIGINISSLSFSGNDAAVLKQNSGMKLSTHLGGFVEFVINDFFAVQPELLYSVKGARFKTDTDADYKSAFVLEYISLPIMVKYFVKERIAIEAGPQIAYLLRAENVETSGLFSSNLGNEAVAINLYNEMKPLDLGVALGVGYITKSGFYLGARYEYGILDIAKPKDSQDISIKNGNIMLSAGFTLNY